MGLLKYLKAKFANAQREKVSVPNNAIGGVATQYANEPRFDGGHSGTSFNSYRRNVTTKENTRESREHNESSESTHDNGSNIAGGGDNSRWKQPTF